VANAIRAATGVTVADLPMTAEVVHRALLAARPGSRSAP
jgi:CO/xanthine dehydrogenase Mo-binding subunit